MIKTYLAGPINGRSDADAKDWRKYVAERVSGETYDPMVRDYRGRELEPGIAAEIVELDKQDIDGCDALIVYFDRPSVGTSMEVFYAWQQNKYIVVINASEKPLSPWLVYHSSEQVATLDEAIVLIDDLYCLACTDLGDRDPDEDYERYVNGQYHHLYRPDEQGLDE